MKYTCVCGETLSNTTDPASYKAHLIADEDWDIFVQSLEEKGRWAIPIYQCPYCGRLRIEKPKGHVAFFKPETENASKLSLRSVLSQNAPSPVYRPVKHPRFHSTELFLLALSVLLFIVGLALIVHPVPAVMLHPAHGAPHLAGTGIEVVSKAGARIYGVLLLLLGPALATLVLLWSR